MSKPGILIFLGLITAALPFLGFPQSWDIALLVALGLTTAIFSFWVGREIKSGTHCDLMHYGKQADSYVQNGMLRYDETTARTPDEATG